MSSTQSPSRIIMVRPACFCFNPETAISNPFQNADLPAEDKIQERTLIEFDSMVEQFRSHGVDVDVFDDTPLPIKPDTIFPDNWFTTHSDGIIILYPMLAENRRPERRYDSIKKLSENYKVTAIIDLSVNENRNEYLEGTGLLTLDRINQIVYAVQSPRTHKKLIEYFTKLMNYQQPPIVFDSVDDKQNVIFHTNVVMSIGTFVVVVCLESINDKNQRDLIVKSLEQNGKRKIIDITFEQMKNFAENMIEIQNKQGQYLLVMSKFFK